MERHPAAYLRRSAAETQEARKRKGKSDTEPSRLMQEASVRRMAQAFEEADPQLYIDWGISGARKDRPDYIRLKQDISDERISTVYCYSLNRLGRNARELLDFFDLCRKHGTKVVSQGEGGLSTDTAMGSFLLTVLSALAELEREMARERIMSAIAVKQERGDAFGQAPVGFVNEWNGERIVRVPIDDPVVTTVCNAYHAADGSAFTAAMLLNAAGIPSVRGKRWAQPAVLRVVRNHDQLMRVPLKRKPYRKPVMRLSGLVLCWCGHTMTANETRGQFYCSRGHAGQHEKPYNTTEAKLMSAVMAEAARFRPPVSVEMGAPDVRRAELEAERERLLQQHQKGYITDDDLDERMLAVQDTLGRLETVDTIMDVPQGIDWQSWAPEAVNAVLRAYWSHVPLDAEMQPAWPADDSHWRLPAKYLAPREA